MRQGSRVHGAEGGTPERATHVLVAEGVWTAGFCRRVRGAMDAGQADAAEIVDGGITLDAEVRRAFDVTLSPRWTARVEDAVRALWPRVDAAFGSRIAGSVGVTCLRYVPGGFYLRHRDRDPRPGSGTEMRRLSLIVWLNSGDTTTERGDFAGGELRLYPGDADAVTITPVAGTLVAFPSDWPHEVLPVTRGTRDVVVDWAH